MRLCPSIFFKIFWAHKTRQLWIGRNDGDKAVLRNVHLWSSRTLLTKKTLNYSLTVQRITVRLVVIVLNIQLSNGHIGQLALNICINLIKGGNFIQPGGFLLFQTNFCFLWCLYYDEKCEIICSYLDFINFLYIYIYIYIYIYMCVSVCVCVCVCIAN